MKQVNTLYLVYRFWFKNNKRQNKVQFQFEKGDEIWSDIDLFYTVTFNYSGMTQIKVKFLKYESTNKFFHKGDPYHIETKSPCGIFKLVFKSQQAFNHYLSEPKSTWSFKAAKSNFEFLSTDILGKIFESMFEGRIKFFFGIVSDLKYHFNGAILKKLMRNWLG